MRAIDFIKAGIPQDFYIDQLAEHFPLAFKEYVNRFNVKHGDYDNVGFHERSLDLFEFHNILPVMVPELYADAVNWNVQVLIHKDIVGQPGREYQRSHFASGTGMYGDNHEFPNLGHAKNFLRILGYVCLERKLAILEKIRPDLEEWYADPTGREELRREEIKLIHAQRALSGENRPRQYRDNPARREPGAKEDNAQDFSSEE